MAGSTTLPTGTPDGAPAVLFVDDEVAILDGLRRQLRRKFAVHTAASGAEGLQLLASQPVSVVVSDMRMPEMNGAEFLSRVRSVQPNAVRILLTGQSDMDAAITAVNEGQIYRFLTKPCSSDVLVDELTGAVELNRLMTAEKELLRTTLLGTVEALTTTLSLAQPKAFARAERVNRTAAELAGALEVEEPWRVEVAAMLAHVGAVTLPPNVLDKLDAGRPLTEDEAEMEARVPEISRDLVRAIPRLEELAQAIGWHRARFDGSGSGIGVPSGEELPLVARILRVAVDFDSGMAQRPSVQQTISALTADAGAYDPRVLDALVRCHHVEELDAPREVGVAELRPGMVVFDDVFTTEGALLVGRGTVVTEPLVQRLENFIAQGRCRSTFTVTG